MTRVYVATPYSDPDPRVRAWRAEIVGRLTAWLWRDKGLIPYSPINHWHDIARVNRLPTEAAPWEEVNRSFLTCCQALYVLQIPGWDASIGVGMEIDWARELRLPIIGATPSGQGYKLEVMG